MWREPVLKQTTTELSRRVETPSNERPSPWSLSSPLTLAWPSAGPEESEVGGKGWQAPGIPKEQAELPSWKTNEVEGQAVKEGDG